MSRELSEIILSMDSKSFEVQFIMQCAPVIAGVKASNLLIIPSAYTDRMYDVVEGTGLTVYALHNSGGRNTFLVYRKELLEECIRAGEAEDILSVCGYGICRGQDIEHILEGFKKRYTKCMESNTDMKKTYPKSYIADKADKAGFGRAAKKPEESRAGVEFPHEMGVLLGYPAEDVRGFIENKGRNFLYTGYWKVYKNLSYKMEMFHTFDTVTEKYLRYLRNGTDIVSMISVS